MNPKGANFDSVQDPVLDEVWEIVDFGINYSGGADELRLND
jgi:hypothetical protein